MMFLILIFFVSFLICFFIKFIYYEFERRS